MSRKDIQKVMENESSNSQENNSGDGDDGNNKSENNDEDSDHGAGDDAGININEAVDLAETLTEKLRRLGCKLIKRRSKIQEAFKNMTL